jgi:hypothetical protein
MSTTQSSQHGSGSLVSIVTQVGTIPKEKAQWGQWKRDFFSYASRRSYKAIITPAGRIPFIRPDEAEFNALSSMDKNRLIKDFESYEALRAEVYDDLKKVCASYACSGFFYHYDKTVA